MKRLIISILALLTLMVFVNAEFTEAFAKRPQIITIAQPVSPAPGLLYVANEKGYLAEEGLNAKIVPFTSGRLALDALLAGKAQVAMVAETPLALAAFQGHKFFIIATMTESPHKLVILKSANVKAPQDLKGKKVSTLVGSAGAFWMYSYLKANGLSTSDVSVINLQPTDMVTALIRGDIDAFFSWEPYPYQAQKELGDKVTVVSSKGIYIQIFNVVVMQDFVQKNPEALERLLKALLKAEKFMKENRMESVKIVAKNSGMDNDVLNGIWDDHKFAIVLDQSLLTILQREGEWAKGMEIVPKDSEIPNYRSFIYTEPLHRLSPTSVTFK